MRTRKCTICSTAFETDITAGRPPAFCSPECKILSRKTPTRYCIICDEPFIGLKNPYGPFYCSQTCQNTKHICECCAKPTVDTKFCSHACVQQMYPPPYECKTCHNNFPPSRYWLNKAASFNGPPRFCSSKCLPMAANPASFKAKLNYDLAMSDIKPTDPYSIPLTQDGLPWIDVQPKWPQKDLHLRSQNTIRFWDYAMNNLLGDLNATQYNRFLFEFVCRRSSPHPKAVELQDCWSIWPYISQYTDHRYMPRLFQHYCSNYGHAKRAHARKAGCMTDQDLRMKVMQCYSASQIQLDPQSIKDQAHKAFCTKWLKPLPHSPAPWPDPTNPRLKGFYSRIQLELQRHDRAIGTLHSNDGPPSYLELTTDEWDELVRMNTALMDFYTAAVFTNATMQRPRKTAAWPWGPNCYGELMAAHRPDPYEAIKWEMATTPNFNLRT